MSSAALQKAPLHRPTSVGSHSPAGVFTAVSSPNYNQNSANASPSSARRSPRRPSGNGPANSPAEQFSPTFGTAPITSRGSSTSKTAAPNTTYSNLAAMTPGDNHRGIPPVVSTRTSSAVSSNPKRAAHAEDRQGGSPQLSEGRRDSTHTNGLGKDDAVAAANTGTRSRRRGQDALPSGSREERNAQPPSAIPPRMQSTANSSPSGPSRQSSKVIRCDVISPIDSDPPRVQERMAASIPSPSSPASQMSQLAIVPSDGVDDNARGHRSRHDHSNPGKKERSSQRFGEYFLGATLGEGEFGKVKMGWKQEGGVQVAIKLIRRDSVGTNPTRLAKIYREIAILREISHPNIVRLHEMVETEKQIGIILEYASGGELFDYILNHRYLKDQAARRLFAQLVSGVGYLHKKGIVHRDLKLENLLLDRNRNIIITDFGFANTFDPNDELGEEIEYHLSNRDYVKRMELDKIGVSGFRKGDLMQTSCGSPCYAAPELVVSDSLYTGRKVDVWSCGVILYAMLAGYLPFDDDPANPEGDNINLLYKYIVSTPLTFPEYVTPHARDLLRRILVPDPRKRADLFEVARHSWLSEFHHVVGFITSSTTSTGDIANTTVTEEEQQEIPLLARSASVREPLKTANKSPPTVGDLSRKHGNIDQDAGTHPKGPKDTKRRTVQVEYVPPTSQTQRGDVTAWTAASRTRARSSQGPVEVHQLQGPDALLTEKPLPRDPRNARDSEYQSRPPSSSRRQQDMPPPSRSVSDTVGGLSQKNTRPGSNRSKRSGSVGFGHRGGSSYSQPVAPTVADTNAQGHMYQPKDVKTYNKSSPLQQDQDSGYVTSPRNVSAKFSKVAGSSDEPAATSAQNDRRRSSTLGSLFSRTNSIFGGSSTSEKLQDKADKSGKADKKRPPISMSGTANLDKSRQSTDSRRSISFGFSKKRSGSITGNSQTDKSTRRFSLLPAAISQAIGLGKHSDHDQYPESRDGYLVPPSTGKIPTPPNLADNSYSESFNPPKSQRFTAQNSQQTKDRYGADIPSAAQAHNPQSPPSLPPLNFHESALNAKSETSLKIHNSKRSPRQPYDANSDIEYEQPSRPPISSQRNSGGRLGSSASNTGGGGILQKNNRKFVDAYETDSKHDTVYGRDNAASSGAARKVMDFFRRRGKARGD